MAVRKQLSSSRFSFLRKLNPKKVTNVTPFAKAQWSKASRFIDRKPLTSFFIALGVLFLVIVLANVFKPKAETVKKPEAVKAVSLYKIGEVPKLQVQAKVEKSGVITINALTGGVVTSVNVNEGDSVSKGANLIQISSNYQGENQAALQSSLAYTQYKNVLDTYQEQKDLINRQRDLASQTAQNASDLRDINNKSLSDTHTLLDENSTILNTLTNNLNTLAANNPGTTDPAVLQQILGAQQLQAQYQATVNQLNSQVRNLELQTNSDKAGSQLSGTQKDIALKQLDIQEKALDLSKETSRLQSAIAQVSADMMHPVAPFAGVVQRVDVRVGQNVTQGTPLITIAGDSNEVKATAYVPMQFASRVSKLEPSTLHFLRKTYQAVPAFVSTEATNGQLYSIVYNIPAEYKDYVLEGGTVTVDVPVGYPDTSGVVPFIPLDSVTVTQDESYVFVANNGKAESRVITLGDVYGRYVEITSGITSGDQVILNRNVVNGDKVTTE